MTAISAGRAWVVVAAVGVSGFLGAPAAAAGPQDRAVPPLPSVIKSCVGASPVTVADPPWAVRRMAPQSVWPLTRGGGVLVAVVDTGVSKAARGLIAAVGPGVDVISGRAADDDCRGRGTALAAIVAARPVTGSGLVGMAPAARVLPVRITKPNGEIPPGALAAGIRAATMAGAEVILVGAAMPSPDAGSLAAVDSAVAADILVVAPAGDERTTSGDAIDRTTAYPAAYHKVLAVAGVGPDGVPAEPPAPPGSNVDLAGPGADAISVAPVGAGHYSVGGSAVAAAYVAGAAALVRAYHPDLTAQEVWQRLELTAEPSPGGVRTTTVGAGTVDAYAAVTAIGPGDAAAREPAAPALVSLPVPPPRPATARVAALAAAGVAAGGALVLAVLATIERGRRRRRWRP